MNPIGFKDGVGGPGTLRHVLVVLAFTAVGWCGSQVYQRFGPPAEPYRAYQRYATAELAGENTAARRALERLSGPSVEILGVEYSLDSQRPIAEERVELRVVQAVHWKYRQADPSHSEIHRTRHRAVMERVNDHWEVAEVSTQDLE